MYDVELNIDNEQTMPEEAAQVLDKLGEHLIERSRVENLAAVMNMATWGHLEDTSKYNLKLQARVDELGLADEWDLFEKVKTEGNIELLIVPEPQCLTAACAIGHMPILFPQDPLRVIFDGDYLTPVFLQKGDLLRETSAIMARFSLTREETRYLFSDSAYGSEEERDAAYVGERIRAFVAAKRAAGLVTP